MKYRIYFDAEEVINGIRDFDSVSGKPIHLQCMGQERIAFKNIVIE